jgi:hypothetical protein
MWANPKSFFRSWNVVERICFPAPKPSYTIKSFPEELILIPGADGEKVPCLFLPFRHARFLFIYFHANAEDLGLCYTFCTIVRDLFQVHMLAVEYPGYGICPGLPSEEGIRANAHAAARFVLETLKWPCDGIKLFGRSIGTGAALALAAENEMAGLILVTPFTSIREIVRHQIGPLADLISDRFPNIDLASKIESPTLIIHGQQDTLIPLNHSKAIYDALPAKKMMVCPALMGHNTSLLANVGTFVMPMTQFFSLPDYTFEDIEVPEWVFPQIDHENSTLEDDNKWVCASSDWMGGTPRKVVSEWRRGGCLGGASVGFPLPAQLQQPMDRRNAGQEMHLTDPSPRMGPSSLLNQGHTPPLLLSTPDTPLVTGIATDVSGGEPSSLKASRNYDFKTPTCSPRDHPTPRLAPAMPTSRSESRACACEKPPNLQGDPHSTVVDSLEEEEEFGKEVTVGDDQPMPSSAQAKEQISEDMLNAISTGISWLVDNSTDVEIRGQDGTSPDLQGDGTSAGPTTLRGATDLKERMTKLVQEDRTGKEPRPATPVTPTPASALQEPGGAASGGKTSPGDESTDVPISSAAGEDEKSSGYRLIL